MIGDEQDAQPSDVMSPPRQSARKPTAANSAQGNSAPAKAAPAKAAPPDDAVSDGTLGAGPAANGAPAARNGIDGTKDVSANGGKDAGSNGSPAVADATIADGVPALPADTIGASRGSRPKESDRDWETPPSKAAEQSSADDSPAFSFGAPPSAAAWSASAAADPAESAAKPSGDDASPTASSGTGLSGTGPSRTAPSGRPSPNVSAAPAESPFVSPAAFAWEMPDPPPNSPSSPARTFLRSGTTEQAAAVATAASSASPGKTGAGKTAAGEGPVTMRNTPQKGRSKRSARQAHLTIARVEPWSVMKFSFVVSLVAFVILFVAVSVLYGVLSGIGVFDSLQRVVASVTSSQGSAGVNAKAWFSASKVLGYTAMLGWV